MDTNPESILKNSFIQLLSFGFSFLDDAILLGISHLGVHCDALQWLSKILLICTVFGWTRRIWIWNGQFWSKKEFVFQKTAILQTSNIYKRSPER